MTYNTWSVVCHVMSYICILSPLFLIYLIDDIIIRFGHNPSILSIAILAVAVIFRIEGNLAKKEAL